MGLKRTRDRTRIGRVSGFDKFFFAIVGAVGLCGAYVSYLALSWTVPSSVAAPAGAVMAACLAAVVALRINESFSERQARELRAQRKEASEELIEHTLKQFVGGSEGGSQREAEIRAKVALWGSPELIGLLKEWHDLVNDLPSGGQLEEAQKNVYRLHVAKVIVAARRDVSISREPMLSAETVANMLFDDYEQTGFSK